MAVPLATTMATATHLKIQLRCTEEDDLGFNLDTDSSDLYLLGEQDHDSELPLYTAYTLPFIEKPLLLLFYCIKYVLPIPG